MKTIVIVSVLFLVGCVRGFGQEIAFNSTVGLKGFPPIEKNMVWQDYGSEHKHCKTFRHGLVLMGIGAGEVLLAGLWINSMSSTASPDLLPVLLALNGVFAFGIGGCMFIGGGIHDLAKKSRYGIIIKGNQMGVAYNF